MRLFEFLLDMLILLGGAMLVSTAQASNLQPTWEAAAIQSHDLEAHPLLIDPRWKGGVLRVRLIAQKVLPKVWHIHLDYGDGFTMELDPVSAASRLVNPAVSNEVTLDLPILSAHIIKATVSPPAVRLKVVQVVFASHAVSQQLIDDSSIDLFDTDVQAAEIAAGQGFGRLDLYSADGQFLGQCTGFRLIKGIWMTAAHCVVRDEPDRPVIRAIKLQPVDYSNREATNLYDATPAATGQTGAQPDPTAYLQSADLDYAILRVPDDPGGPNFSLANKTSAHPEELLQLFQHWTGIIPPTPGKARSAGNKCVVLKRFGPNDKDRPELCPNAIQHGCSTEPGASGGPLVERQSLNLVGMHYRGGLDNQFNCALPAKTISDHLCAYKPELARMVTSCEQTVDRFDHSKPHF
jgi:hypothetical protein